MRRTAWASCLLLLTAWPLRAAGMPPHVYLVVVDGLDAEGVEPALMPRLFDAAVAPVVVRGEARATMPTRTNPNHVTLLTGVPAQDHGITGNGYVDRVSGTWGRLEAAAQIEIETLFTVLERTAPARVTVGAFSKAKLGRLFAAVPGRQHAPDVSWVPADGGLLGVLAGIASDRDTMTGFLAAAAETEPDFAVINLSGVDRAAHEHGPAATSEARREASLAIGSLVDDLHARGRWERSVVIVTADHGFDDVSRGSRIVLSRAFEDAGLSGMVVAGEGGAAYVYAVGDEAHAPDRLAWAAAVAWRTPGVAEVVSRLAVPGVRRLAEAHPGWGLEHERAGDLVVIAAPGQHFVEPGDRSASFRGNHGSPGQERVPLLIMGGALDASPMALPASVTAADVGATIAALLGVPIPRRFDGAATRPGRPIAMRLR